MQGGCLVAWGWGGVWWRRLRELEDEREKEDCC